MIKLNIDLCYTHNFPQRNDFGPVPSVPGPIENKNINISIAQSFKSLLLSFTAAEAVSTRQVTPLISIIRLSNGNIGSN